MDTRGDLFDMDAYLGGASALGRTEDASGDGSDIKGRMAEAIESHARRMRGMASRLLAFMRIEDIPRPVIVALALLIVVATILGVVLHGQMSSSFNTTGNYLGDTGGAISSGGSEGGFSEGPASRSVGEGDSDTGGDGGEGASSDTRGDSRGPVTAGASATDSEGGERDGASGSIEEPEPIVVDVGGAVVSPGVYELPLGARVVDAINAAGGTTDLADLSAVNQASTLQDASKVFIPRTGEQTTVPIQTNGTTVMTGSGTGLAYDQGASANSSTQPVNINTATADELQRLPGIGESIAQAIVEERSSGGPFASADDLLRVSGIGEKKLQQIMGLICT